MRNFLVGLIGFILCAGLAFGDQGGTAATADPIYRQLREVGIGNEAVSVTNFVLKRDAGTFTFRQGTFVFLAPVNGKVTGAVFSGEGEFTLAPPIPSEVKSLQILTKRTDASMTEWFKTVVLRFTDDTYQEIKKASTGGSTTFGTSTESLQRAQDAARKKIKTNYDARIMKDVVSSTPGGFFLAFIDGLRYSNKMLYCIDPDGLPEVAPEEVALETYDENKYGIWAAFHFSNEYGTGAAKGTQENTTFDIELQNLDTKLEKNGFLHGNALTTIVSRNNDLRLLGFMLFPTLRVQKVTDATGNPLPFIQEDKDRDADYWVILPKGLARGEKIQIRTVYEGKDAVISTGDGNYFPVARDDWYPNLRFGRYANYELKFSTPKKVQIVATGALVSQSAEGDQNVTVWKSEAPLAVAGFNLGDFKKYEAKVGNTGYTIESYANKEPPDFVKEIKREAEGDSLPSQIGMFGSRTTGLAVGGMYTTSMMEKPLAEGQLAVGLYNDYFGPIPYKRVSITQQTACNFGQSWPNLVYLPICSFFDSYVQHQLGLDDTRGYWKTVAAHEVAHQWWGHAVGFNSYRDQWMSEGFSEFSASLYVQVIQKNNAEFIKLWKDQLELITERNKQGFRAIDVGPLTGGYRLNNTRTGNVYRNLIYPKGAFVLHMLRMMMWSPQTRDKAFIEMMRDFVQTYANRPASTEDFKATVEKHMLPGMNLDGNGKMDWFFNDYVYGTSLPNYNLESSIGPGENGAFLLKLKLTQSNVDEKFKMSVPVYLELADGHMVRLGAVNIVGNRAFEQTLPLTGLQQMPKRAVLNYFYDVLGTGY